MEGKVEQVADSTPVEGAAAAADAAGDQKINPWNVEGGKDGIDYNKLIDQFGCSPIDEALLQRLERVSGRPVHPWLRRGLFFSHRCPPCAPLLSSLVFDL